MHNECLPCLAESYREGPYLRHDVWGRRGGSWYNNVGCIVESGILVPCQPKVYRFWDTDPGMVTCMAKSVPVYVLSLELLLRCGCCTCTLALGYLLLPTVSVSPPVLSECSVNMQIIVLLPFMGWVLE